MMHDAKKMLKFIADKAGYYGFYACRPRRKDNSASYKIGLLSRYSDGTIRVSPTTSYVYCCLSSNEVNYISIKWKSSSDMLMLDELPICAARHVLDAMLDEAAAGRVVVAKHDYVIHNCVMDSHEITLMKKNTTFEQLLVEMDLEDNERIK